MRMRARIVLSEPSDRGYLCHKRSPDLSSRLNFVRKSQNVEGFREKPDRVILGDAVPQCLAEPEYLIPR